MKIGGFTVKTTAVFLMLATIIFMVIGALRMLKTALDVLAAVHS